MQIISSNIKFHVLQKSFSDSTLNAIAIENVQEEAEIIFLMELNNYGGEYELHKVSTTRMESEDGIHKRFIKDIEVIDMKDKIEKYKKEDGGLRSDGYGNPQSPRKEHDNV